MAKKFPLHPKHPERICWGCDKYCPVDSLECGNGSDRTQHPVELLGEDWLEHGDWGIESEAKPTPPKDDAKTSPADRLMHDARCHVRCCWRRVLREVISNEIHTNNSGGVP